MNITITQDNTRTELLGSYGAQIIHKLYELAVDSDNTVTLRGTINSASAYEDDVTYLNTEFGPDLTVSATMQYVSFEDPNAAKVCAVFFGDGVGVTKAQMANADFSNNNIHDITVNEVTLTNSTFGNAFSQAGVVKFNEFKYFTGINGNSDGDWWTGFSLWGIAKNATLKEISLPPSFTKLNAGAYPNNMTPNIGNIKINNSLQITYVNYYATKFVSNTFDFSKISGDYRKNGYGYGILSYAIQDVAILPTNTVANWSSSEDICCVIRNSTNGIKTVIVPDSVQCSTFDVKGYGNNGYNIPPKNFLENLIFLGTTPPYSSLVTGNNVDNFKIYVPDSASSTYGNATLSQFANKAEENKALLEECGCTVTGTFGSYVVKAPNEP